MLRADAVSLRGGGDEVELGDRMVTFVCPGPLRLYVKEQARTRTTPSEQVKERDVYIGALELDRALEVGLKDDGARLRAYAAAKGLDLRKDFEKVIVAAVHERMEAFEAEGLRLPPPPKKGGK